MQKVNYTNPFKNNMRTQTTISFIEANLLSAYYSIVKDEYKDISKEEVQEMFIQACEDFKKSEGYSEFVEEQEEEKRVFKECVINNCIFEMAHADNVRKTKINYLDRVRKLEKL